MKHGTKGTKRAHLNLTPAHAATLKRLVDHLSTAQDRKITSSAAIRFAIARTVAQYDAVSAL